MVLISQGVSVSLWGFFAVSWCYSQWQCRNRRDEKFLDHISIHKPASTTTAKLHWVRTNLTSYQTLVNDWLWHSKTIDIHIGYPIQIHNHRVWWQPWSEVIRQRAAIDSWWNNILVQQILIELWAMWHVASSWLVCCYVLKLPVGSKHTLERTTSYTRNRLCCQWP